MKRTLGMMIACTAGAWLILTVPSHADVDDGNTTVALAVWEAKTHSEREELVLAWGRQCRAEGYMGTVRVWSQGKALLATHEWGRSVELYDYAPPRELLTAADRRKPDQEAAQWLLYAAIFVIAFCLWAMVMQRVFRVNHIVALLREIREGIETLNRRNVG